MNFISICLLGYLDPGTGSMILQFALGAVLGASFFLRNTFRNVFGWARSRFRGSDHNQQETGRAE